VVWLYADGPAADSVDLMAGLARALPSDTVVAGVLAPRSETFESAWVLGPSGLGSGRVVVMGLYAALVPGFGSPPAGDPIEPARAACTAGRGAPGSGAALAQVLCAEGQGVAHSENSA
jgi:hypothetical protein